jgi:hypothetical protein
MVFTDDDASCIISSYGASVLFAVQPHSDIPLKKWNKHTGAGRRGNSGKKAKVKEPMAEALPSEGQSLMSRRVISSS